MPPDYCAPAAFVFAVAHIRDPLARAQEDAGGIAATVGQTLCGLPMSVAELWQLLDFDPQGNVCSRCLSPESAENEQGALL